MVMVESATCGHIFSVNVLTCTTIVLTESVVVPNMLKLPKTCRYLLFRRLFLMDTLKCADSSLQTVQGLAM